MKATTGTRDLFEQCNIELMERRQFLATIGATGVTGCLGNSDRETASIPEESETTSSTDTTSRTQSVTRATDSTTAAGSSTDSPTETPQCLGQGDRRLSLGESIRYENWKFAVTSVELTQTYQLDSEDETRTLPDGKQFVIVTIDAANRGTERETWWFDSGFSLIGSRCTLFEWTWHVPTESDVSVPISRLQRIPHQKQYHPQVGYPFDPGEEGQMWYTALTSGEFSRDELEVASDFSDDPMPVRWVPTAETTDS